MWEHAKQACKGGLQVAGGEYPGAAEHSDPPGHSLRETWTRRMGNDPKRFVTNRFGQSHDGSNRLVATQACLELHR